MSEKKMIGRNVAIVLGIVAIILLIGLVGAIVNYTSIINEKDATISSLNSQIQQLQAQLSNLNASYIWLKQHSFTYYVVGNDINISNVGIYRGWFYTIVNGTVTNIGNKPVKELYIYAILVDPDGTRHFSPYDYDKVTDLYMGETATFAIDVAVEENQTVTLFVIY